MTGDEVIDIVKNYAMSYAVYLNGKLILNIEDPHPGMRILSALGFKHIHYVGDCDERDFWNLYNYAPFATYNEFAQAHKKWKRGQLEDRLQQLQSEIVRIKNKLDMGDYQ